jgi:hypothetical protein
MTALSKTENDGAPSARGKDQGNATAVSNAERLIFSGPIRVRGLKPPYVPGSGPCTVMDLPCNHRKGYMCHNDCECPHDPALIEAYQDQVVENTPTSRTMERTSRRARA